MRRVFARLASLRRRVRALYAANGLARFVILAIMLMTITYVLDRALVLPRSVRMFAFFVAVAALALEAARGLVYPLRKTLRTEDLAATIEKRFPELQNRLISSIQFSKSIDDPDFVDSKPLALRTIETTLDEVERLPFHKAIVAGSVHRLAAAAIVGALAIGMYGAMNPQYSATWFRRIIALEDVRWPRQTFLEVILQPQGRNLFITQSDDRSIVTLAAGEDLLVRVKANGKVPRSVNITYDRVSDRGTGSRELETRLLSKVGPRDFQYSFVGVTDSFEFFVRGGDDQNGDRIFKVEVLPPPRVESLTFECSYPPYTGMPPATFEGGNLEVPVGTSIEATIVANLPIDRALLSLDQEDGIPLERIDDRRFGTTILVDGDRLVSFPLFAENGLRNTRPMRVRLRATPDLPPRLQLFGVAGLDFDATPQAALPIRVITTDDYGVSNVRLLAAAGRDMPPVEIALGPGAHIPANPDTAPSDAEFPITDRVLTVALLDLESLQFGDPPAALEPGDVLHYELHAADTHTDPDGTPMPQVKETEPFRVHIVKQSELERKLNDWQVRLKSRLQQTRSTQESIRNELRELQEFDTGADDLSSADSQSILDAEIDQNRITNETQQVGRDFRQIFNTYLYNRIENSPLTAKLIASLQDSARDIELEEVERYRALFARVSDGERQKSDILGKQLTMIEIALAICEDLSPNATEYLTAARKADEGEERKRLVATALERQNEILAQLAILLDKMEEWEDFQEVLQETKDLLELQKSVRNRTLRELEAEREKRGDDGQK